MTPFSQARLIVTGGVVALFVSLGLYAWYQHSQSVKKDLIIENQKVNIETKKDEAKVKNFEDNQSIIFKINKEVHDEEDSYSVGNHTITL